MARLEDVARAAGVSISTVSRVLNESHLVNEKTRATVQRAIKALGYQPSRVARRLRMENGRAHLLGLLIPDIQNPFFADLARGVEDVAQHHGYMVFLCNSDEDVKKEKRYLDILKAESVDGVILPPASEKDGSAYELARSGLPMVCVDRCLSTITVDTVIVDSVRGAYEATEHLIRFGHRRIGFIGGLPTLSTSKDRIRGYRQALEDHGIDPDASLIREGDSRQESGRRLAQELIALTDPPTALFVGNNLMTLGALETIHLNGLRIPKDISVVSYDDMPWALALNPPLTAVWQPGYEVGRRAVELLLQRFEDPSRSASLLVLQPKLIVRKSCGSELQARSRGNSGKRPSRPAGSLTEAGTEESE